MRIGKALKVTLSITAFAVAFALGAMVFFVGLGAVVPTAWSGNVALLVLSGLWLAILGFIFSRYLRRGDWPG